MATNLVFQVLDEIMLRAVQIGPHAIKYIVYLENFLDLVPISKYTLFRLSWRV